MASRPPKPLSPTVKLMQPDGKPTRDFHTFLTELYEEVRRPGQDSDFEPTAVSVPAQTSADLGGPGRIVATMSAKGSFPPVVYVIRDNVDNLQVAFTGADLKTTATPFGTVGPHTLGIRATDAKGRTYQGALLITVT